MTKQQDEYQHYLVVAFVLLLTGASISMHQFKVPTIMGEVAKSLNMSDNAATWLMSIFTLMGILLAIPAGGIVQKFGGKTTVLLSCLFVAVGSILGAVSVNSGIMLISRAIEGLGFLFVAVAGPITIAHFCDPSKIGISMGIWAVWVGTGEIIAFNLTPFLFGKIGWKSIWIVYGIVTLVMAIIIKFVLVERNGANKEVKSEASAEKAHVREVLNNKNLICATLAFAIFNFLLMAVLAFLPSYAVKAGLMGTAEASFAATIPMICCLVGSPVIGKLSEKYGAKKMYILSMTASGIGAAMSFSASTIVIYIGLIIFGLIGIGAPGIMFGSVSRLVNNPRLDGVGMGITIAFQNLGMFLGTAIFLPIVAICGGSYTIAGLIMLPLAVVGIVLVTFTKFAD